LFALGAGCFTKPPPPSPEPGCDPEAPFTSIGPVSELNTPALEGGLRLSEDERVAYFHRQTGTKFDVWSARRDDVGQQFGPAAIVIQDARDLVWPTVTSDQLTIVVGSTEDLFVAVRDTPEGLFGTPTLVAGVSSTDPAVATPWLAGTDQLLYFTRYAPEGAIHVTRWPETDTGQVQSVETALQEVGPVVSRDDRLIYFARGSPVQTEILMARRDDPEEPFGAGFEVAELKSPMEDVPTWLSGDRCRLYFESTRTGNRELYIAERSL
jgi:hypothetical protein